MLKPFDFQTLDAARITRQHLLCANDTGTGKTCISIEAILELLKLNYSHKPVLICVPKTIKKQWADALKEQFDRTNYFNPENGERRERMVISGTDIEVDPYDDNFAEWSILEPSTEKIDIPIIFDYPLPNVFYICLTHHENVRVNIEAFKAIDWFVIIVDEAHKMSNQDNKFTKAIKQLKADRKVALTGTPFDRNPAKIWSILNWLDRDMYSNYWSFDSTHTLYRFNKVVGCRNKQLFAAAIAPYTVRRTKREIWGELPEKMETLVKLPLGTEQAKAYASVLAALNEALSYEDSDGEKEFQVFGLLALITRCQQATSFPAGIKQNGGYPFVNIRESTKIDYTVSWIEEMVSRNTGVEFDEEIKAAQDEVHELLGLTDENNETEIPENEKLSTLNEKVIVFCCFKETVDEISRRLNRLGISHSLLVGGMKPAMWEHELSKFKATDNRWNQTDVAIAIIEAAGTGLDIPMCDTEIFLDLEYSSIKMKQASDRIRDSFTRKKQLIYLVNEGTIDETVYKAFKGKLSEQKFIFDAVELAQKGYESAETSTKKTFSVGKKRGRPRKNA